MLSEKRIEEIKLMRKLKSEGKTYQEIGNIFHFSRQRVQQLLKPSQETIEQIYNRANGKCEKCGSDLGRKDIHHINYIESDANSCQYLCLTCHYEITRKLYTKNTPKPYKDSMFSKWGKMGGNPLYKQKGIIPEDEYKLKIKERTNNIRLKFGKDAFSDWGKDNNHNNPKKVH